MTFDTKKGNKPSQGAIKGSQRASQIRTWINPRTGKLYDKPFVPYKISPEVWKCLSCGKEVPKGSVIIQIAGGKQKSWCDACYFKSIKK